ncbi:haloacid dehalogenase [Penicillium argentinense]|uniref:Haloacid dehalogenase n=1 Tax=Penicillium argentinense TaxID=1131581 RepID=A0A9W9EWJ0_9EURO|nr:haloacid dehalogenase [Penicillium argentinense]KAJ5089196.1 haloacid dehalogenase [Penicillium argentinense]
MTEPKIKAVFFDFMGTCLDWHSSVVRSLPSSIPEDDRSEFALEWRRRYFIENNQRFKQGLSPEDIDVTLARVLETVLPDFPTCSAAIDSEVKRQMIQAWHTQPAWPEVNKAIQSLRDDLGLEVFVHANGTTRLQLDLARSSGLNFNMMFSSQLLGAYKPSPHAYMKALELVKFEPQEVVLVAAHAYDLRGAQSCGMKGVYVHRWTDDVDEDMTTVKTEFDAFLDGMEGLPRVLSRWAA